MFKQYRPKGLGAMIDEYQRAVNELTSLVQTIGESDFILERPGEASKCRSVQLIMQHVAQAAYRYAGDIRRTLGVSVTSSPPEVLENRIESINSVNKSFDYMVDALAGKWSMSDEEIDGITMTTQWGITYTLEQMLEHAIVHVLRHRRQVERLVGK